MSELTRSFKPGWQILEEAALAVLSEQLTEEAIGFFQVQLLARKTELIPEEHIPRLTGLIFTACCVIYAKEPFWPIAIAKFFEEQYGKAEVAQLLEANLSWEVRDHNQSPLGYIVFNKDYRAPLSDLDVQAARKIASVGSRVERGPAGLLVVTKG